ncbi:Mut7-C RNAse domain-containing protein [Georgenia sp. MJ206]|uniref:Mut7-C RNAse domain-containing protein n=1 Tax=Georgenia wangjunii TaxID=3117730 RepID=UPI002F26AF9A
MRGSEGQELPHRSTSAPRFPAPASRAWCEAHALPRRPGEARGHQPVALRVAVDPALWFLLPRARRTSAFPVSAAPSDTVGNVTIALGIPRTEVGPLVLDGHLGPASSPVSSGLLRIGPAPRPQQTSTTPPRFLLDVHLGALARRLRLLGLDTAHETHADDAGLVRRAAETARVLLTRDRALLYRSALPEGALVRGTLTQDQLDDVLGRFAPPLSPWTRCTRCNGLLEPASVADVAADIEPGTCRAYDVFSRCGGCARVYWRGAHAPALEAVVARAERVVTDARQPLPVAPLL